MQQVVLRGAQRKRGIVGNVQCIQGKRFLCSAAVCNDDQRHIKIGSLVQCGKVGEVSLSADLHGLSVQHKTVLDKPYIGVLCQCPNHHRTEHLTGCAAVRRLRADGADTHFDTFLVHQKRDVRLKDSAVDCGTFSGCAEVGTGIRFRQMERPQSTVFQVKHVHVDAHGKAERMQLLRGKIGVVFRLRGADVCRQAVELLQAAAQPPQRFQHTDAEHL